LQQLFFRSNPRTSRFMMNGVLVSNGTDASSVPAAKGRGFNGKMVRFCILKEGSAMMAFLLACHADDCQPARS
jgi:hypothetical protein